MLRMDMLMHDPNSSVSIPIAIISLLVFLGLTYVIWRAEKEDNE